MKYWVKNVGDPTIGWDNRDLWPALDTTKTTADVWFPDARRQGIQHGDWFVIYAVYGPGRVVGFGQAITPLQPRDTSEAWDAQYPWKVRIQLEAYVTDPWSGWKAQDPDGQPFPVNRGSHWSISAATYEALLEGFRRHLKSIGGQ